MIKLLIADDHPIIRRGIRDILKGLSFPINIYEVDTAQEAIKLTTSEKFDIILLDISFPDGNGLEILKHILSINPDTKVLMISVYPEEQYARRVLKSGAYGYLTKDSAPKELISAIEKVMKGEKYVTLTLAEKLVDYMMNNQDNPLHEKLSDREYHVMLSIAKGSTITQIANELGLSPKTISTYRSRILKKLGISTNAEIIKYAIEQELLG